MAHNHFVYMIRCKDATLYTGYTTDVHKRFAKHQAGKGAKYTRGRGPLELMYTEGFATTIEAMQREYELKQLSKQAKLSLINQRKEEYHGTSTTELPDEGSGRVIYCSYANW